ncbi:TPA: hypothetical protein ACG3KH_004146, partial [Clostridioides difficile]
VETEVLQALLAAPDQRTFVGLRDYTLIVLTLDTGIRPSEAMKLIPQDFKSYASIDLEWNGRTKCSHIKDSSH